jgi:PIN domain nuclease of toxin-antitoxin system
LTHAVILDTVAALWAVSAPERLSRAAKTALRKATAVRELSVVSLTEIAIKQNRGKLTFGRADATAGVADLRLRALQYAAEQALLSAKVS